MTRTQARAEAQRLADALEAPVGILKFEDDYYPLFHAEHTRVTGEIVETVQPA